MDIFHSNIDDETLKREKSKARLLRNSQWWKRRKNSGLCHYCGAKFAPAELTMDHIVPISRGGKSSKGNTVPACKTCNNQKKYLLPIEWEERLETLNKKD